MGHGQELCRLEESYGGRESQICHLSSNNTSVNLANSIIHSPTSQLPKELSLLVSFNFNFVHLFYKHDMLDVYQVSFPFPASHLTPQLISDDGRWKHCSPTKQSLLRLRLGRR